MYIYITNKRSFIFIRIPISALNQRGFIVFVCTIDGIHKSARVSAADRVTNLSRVITVVSVIYRVILLLNTAVAVSIVFFLFFLNLSVNVAID